MQKLCPVSKDLLPELSCRLLHGTARHVGRAGGIGAGVVGGDVRVRVKALDPGKVHIQHLGCDLGEGGVAPCSHVCRAHDEVEKASVRQLDRRTSLVHSADAGALHRHRNAVGKTLPVAELLHGKVFIPVNSPTDALEAPVQGAAPRRLPEVGGHHHALPHLILLPDRKGVQVQGVRELIHRGLHRKDALGRTVSPVGAGGHVIGVHTVPGEPEGLGTAVERNGLVAGEADCGRPVLAVGAGVGEGVQGNPPYRAILHRAELYVQFHRMPGRGGCLGLHSRKDNHRRLFQLPGDKGGVDRGHRGLLCPKTAADSGLPHPDHRLRDVQGVGDDSPRVEHDLGRRRDHEPPEGVDLGIAAEGLHHRLLAGLGPVCPVDHDIAGREHRIDVAGTALLVGDEIPHPVPADAGDLLPVLLRVDHRRIVQGDVHVQHGGQDLVLHPDEGKCPLTGLLRPSDDQGHRVSDKAHVPVQDEPVHRGGLRRRLPRLGVALPVLVHILISKDRDNAGNFQRPCRIDVRYHRIGMGASEHPDHKTLPGGNVSRIARRAGQEFHGVLLAHRLSHNL